MFQRVDITAALAAAAIVRAQAIILNSTETLPVSGSTATSGGVQVAHGRSLPVPAGTTSAITERRLWAVLPSSTP